MKDSDSIGWRVSPQIRETIEAYKAKHSLKNDTAFLIEAMGRLFMVEEVGCKGVVHNADS